MRVRLALPVALGIACCALVASAAAAPERYVSMPGARAPGPARYDRVWVKEIGRASAKHVLVLVPGTTGAAGSVTPVGRDIQARLGSTWQVWATDRREVAFQDESVLRSGDPAAADAYYLGFKYHQVKGSDVPFARQWGMAVAINDLHGVVERARAGGRRTVVLGGHSLGASEAIVYASWDFAGRAGYRDLAGVVLIDGGELGAFSGGRVTSLTLAQAKAAKAAIDSGEPFDDILGLGIPSAPPILGTVAALYSARAPNAPSALQTNPLISALKANPTFSLLLPPFPLTNEAFFGNIFDDDHSPPSFASLRIRGGRLAATGNPRPWINGENTPIPRFAAAFSTADPTFAEWYFPRRLTLDTGGANTMRRDPVTRLLGLRTWHTRQINVPLYAYQTDLTHGGVIAGARNVKRASRISRLVVVDDGQRASHLDPVVGVPARNRFLHTVLPFLRSLTAP